MEAEQTCPECGSAWTDGNTCQDHFHQMLFWEHENPANGVVHHLLVLSYRLQHPSLYSPEGLNEARRLLEAFLEQGVTPEQARKRNRVAMDSGKRKFKITGTPASHGVYHHPIQWSMTAAEVTARGVHDYCDSVRAWARSVYEALMASGNLHP